MTSHSRHSVTAVTLPVLLVPADVAVVLRRSEWWVKEQARKHRIPFCRIGGGYRFTPDHLAEIILLFEERPTAPCTPAATLPGTRRQPHRGPTTSAEPAVRLQARTPRRVLRAAGAESAAA